MKDPEEENVSLRSIVALVRKERVARLRALAIESRIEAQTLAQCCASDATNAEYNKWAQEADKLQKQIDEKLWTGPGQLEMLVKGKL